MGMRGGRPSVKVSSFRRKRPPDAPLENSPQLHVDQTDAIRDTRDSLKPTESKRRQLLRNELAKLPDEEEFPMAVEKFGEVMLQTFRAQGWKPGNPIDKAALERAKAKTKKPRFKELLGLRRKKTTTKPKKPAEDDSEAAVDFPEFS